ncbi:type II secretion system F family protein [Gilvimarinus sp. SDUM040013]|uniref:Type II secretion system F family protein n=1 Tax=Gilvimarinus gilvus TaxID=3058038 RepID=A0ABU4S1N6_9GAMM|nr:type II secretion system F family protein [Gilvimarinus sp. SDUM040013]MDO3386262.1 type II secretion system F family protein [Gilvimarinus sp. SDUM040013]MDX6849743.1 type II secretion system F family protein [Gilvimarinus sp. SDUM040013]
MHNLIALAAGFSVAMCVIAAIYMIASLSYMLVDEERSYMDEPPAFMRPIWPLIKLVTYVIGSNLPSSYLTKVDDQLQKNGVSFMVTAEEYISARIILALLLPALGFMALASSGSVDPLLLILLAAGGFYVPIAWVKDTRRKRDAELIRSLPVYLEYLTMCVDAGLNFAGALKQAVEKGPRGAMRNEFRIVLRDISSGQTRGDALNRLAERVDLKDISVFVRAVVQAEKMGSSMKNTLLIQAKTRLNERFQRAEKMAMEAPVKLVIPLVIFIFPLTFIILLFPIVVKYIEQGTF